TMNKKLNSRLLIGSLVAIFLTADAVLAVHAYQVRRTAGALLERAARAEERERPDRAALLMGRYLLLCPDDTEARIRYATVLDRLARSPVELRRAMAVFDGILAREPDRHDVRRRLATLAIQLSNYRGALEYLKVLHDSFPDDAEVEFLNGQCYEAAGN